MEVMSSGKPYDKNRLAKALNMPSQAPLSNGPGSHALAALVESGKLIKEGRGYRIVKNESSVVPLSLSEIDMTLQSTLDAFVKNVLIVVSQQYERDRARQAKALSQAEARISELSSELATVKFNKNFLPNIRQSIQNHQ